MTVPWLAVLLGRVTVALVWLYEGLVAKIIGTRTDELAIIASLPLLTDSGARIVMIMIGVAEIAIALWVLTGWHQRVAATVQTLVLIGFNTGGLLFGGAEIPDPAHLLITNLALLALVWLVALARRPLREPTDRTDQPVARG